MSFPTKIIFEVDFFVCFEFTLKTNSILFVEIVKNFHAKPGRPVYGTQTQLCVRVRSLHAQCKKLYIRALPWNLLVEVLLRTGGIGEDK